MFAVRPSLTMANISCVHLRARSGTPQAYKCIRSQVADFNGILIVSAIVVADKTLVPTMAGEQSTLVGTLPLITTVRIARINSSLHLRTTRCCKDGSALPPGYRYLSYLIGYETESHRMRKPRSMHFSTKSRVRSGYQHGKHGQMCDCCRNTAYYYHLLV